ncbi:adenosylcobinamide-GDP ribazoletransferase [Candidatus Marsarchaeota G2 archaeon ECH_B_SAG-M15]|uniref:Adenosylcobinamide-GDP ribazoletransferase n=1 Tax=Candidatus Marsarchaeota G2 archaeon ECH_B_SAG-M15 TaxID=1978162 RepID=A0A2R6AWG1_9ARCH|nr:MAG: adenosylcobinamide-GDP ribazoletransferase [Candidatus Marsarchaeota G2 archaeon ECH_B_SAG-M15]
MPRQVAHVSGRRTLRTHRRRGIKGVQRDRACKMNPAKMVRAAFSFLTSVPLPGGPTTIEDVAQATPIFPIIGYLTGGVSGVILYLSLRVFNPFLSSTLAIAALLLVTGANELDGFVDFADGAMCVGSYQRRLEAMRDPHLGVGGMAAGLLAFSVQLFSWAQLSRAPFTATLVYEVFGKLAMVYLSVLGSSVTPSSAEPVTKHMHTRRGAVLAVASTLLCVPMVLLVGLTPTLSLIVLDLVCATFLMVVSKRLIGGLSGDVFGAANIIAGSACTLLIVRLH